MTPRRRAPCGSRLALLAILILAACGVPAPSAVDTQGAFRLTFSLTRATYHATEAISGTATLSVTNGSTAPIAASGDGPLGFSFDEVGGTRHMGTLWHLDCRGYSVGPGSPIASPVKKGAGWSAEDPNAAF